MIKKKCSMKLETNRLIIREFNIDDAQQMFENWVNDKEVCKYLSWEAHSDVSVTKKLLSTWISEYKYNTTCNLAIVFKDIDKVIGTISLIKVDYKNSNCEIAFSIGKKYWSKGITTEAVKIVLNYLFNELAFNRIEALQDVKNIASGRVLEKSNMILEGTLRQARKRKDGTYGDINVWSIIKNEYNLDNKQ